MKGHRSILFAMFIVNILGIGINVAFSGRCAFYGEWLLMAMFSIFTLINVAGVIACRQLLDKAS